MDTLLSNPYTHLTLIPDTMELHRIHDDGAIRQIGESDIQWILAGAQKVPFPLILVLVDDMGPLFTFTLRDTV